MFSAPQLARRIGIVAVAVAVVGSMSACSSKSLIENFTSKIEASDFQASGSIDGSFSMTAAGTTYDATISGTIKIKGKDSAQTMKIDIAATGTVPASSTTTDTVTVGDSEYTRTDGGDWTKKARNTDNDISTILQSVAVTDKGVETHHGQQLHRLESTKSVDPKVIFSDSNITNANLTLTFWAKDDGSPAGMSLSGTYTQDADGTPTAVTISMNRNFDSLSGVTIEAPSM